MKRLLKIVSICIALMLVFATIIGTQTPLLDAHAATVKISKTKVTLNKGSSTTLKIIGTKSKPKWASGDKSVATVNSAGKVTAKKAGKATIIARVGKAKYYCKVTVKNPTNYKKLIVGMWEGPWESNGHAEFHFDKNKNYSFEGYWDDSSNSCEGKYDIRGNKLVLDTGETFTIKSITKSKLTLIVYGHSYTLQGFCA